MTSIMHTMIVGDGLALYFYAEEFKCLLLSRVGDRGGSEVLGSRFVETANDAVVCVDQPGTKAKCVVSEGTIGNTPNVTP